MRRSEPLFAALSGSTSTPRGRRYSLPMHYARLAGSSHGGAAGGRAPSLRSLLRVGIAVSGALVAALLVLASSSPVMRGGSGGSSAWPALLRSRGPPTLTFPVWWFAPFYSGSGYGDEALSYVTALLRTGAMRREDLWLTHSGDTVSPTVVAGMEPSGRALLEQQEYAHLVRGGLPQAELSRPTIAICHSFPDCWGRPLYAGSTEVATDDEPMTAPGCPCPPLNSGGVVYRIGRTMFETASVPAHLVAHCNAMDEVWVPTEFNRASFADAGVDPAKLRVVEEGINTTYWDPTAFSPLDPADLKPQQIAGLPRQSDAQGRKPFVFLSVFKLEARKGWDVLLDAYLAEFGPHEDVELHLVTRNRPGAKAAVADAMWRWLARARQLDRKRDAGHMPRIFLHTRRIPDDLYPRLYLAADAVVLPTRGEGWGRPQMEAMAMARPLITTNWSGPTEYLTEETGYPLQYDGLTSADIDMLAVEVDARGGWNPWFAGQSWARPSVPHLRTLMRRVVARPDEAAARGRAARALVVRRFSPAALAAAVAREIARVQQRLAANPEVPRHFERSAPPKPGAAGAGAQWEPLAGGAGAIRTRAQPVVTGAGAAPVAPPDARPRPQYLWQRSHPRHTQPLQFTWGDGRPTVQPGAAAGGQQGQSKGAAGDAAGSARQGFTRAGGVLGTRVDTTTMTLPEVLAAMDPNRPRPPVTLETPGGLGTPAPMGAGNGAWRGGGGSGGGGGGAGAAAAATAAAKRPRPAGGSREAVPGEVLPVEYEGAEGEEEEDDADVVLNT